MLDFLNVYGGTFKSRKDGPNTFGQLAGIAAIILFFIFTIMALW